MANLIDAVRLGDREVVRALLGKDPQALHRGDSRGMTPLMWAAWHGAAPLVRELLERGAQPMVRDARGATALRLAAERGHLEAARELLPAADANERGEALRHAVGAGRHELTAWLLDEAGAALEFGGADGRTPLVCAILGGHSALTDELLRRGADVAAPSDHLLPLDNHRDGRWRPLHHAADRRHPLLAQLLLDAGAGVDEETERGTTPLMLSVRHGDEDTVRVLLLAGARPARENLQRESALTVARAQGRPHITRLLELEAEADPPTPAPEPGGPRAERLG